VTTVVEFEVELSIECQIIFFPKLFLKALSRLFRLS
jgi:hypothetical protein